MICSHGLIAQLVRAPSRFEGTNSARADSVGSNPTQAYFSSIMAIVPYPSGPKMTFCDTPPHYWTIL